MNDNNQVSKKSPAQKVPKNVVFMGLVSLFNDIASEMVYPIIPIFLNTVLKAPISVIGFIEGLAESTASFLKLVSGWFSDKLEKRKPFVVLGYSLSSFSKLFLGFATSWPMVLFARFLDRFGKGARVSSRDALILESVEPENRGRAFGFHRSMDSIGAVVGPLLALLALVFFKEKLTTIFFLAFIPSIIGVLVLIVFVKEVKNKINSNRELSPPSKLRWSAFSSRFKIFLIISAVFAIGNSSDAFLILRAQNLGMSITLAVAAYVVYNISYALFSYPAGILSDKISPKKILVGGYILFAIVYGGFGLIRTENLVWILFFSYGIYMALTDGISRAYIADTIPKEISGTAFGAQQMVSGLCIFLSSVLAGLLWKLFGPAVPFYFGSVTGMLSAILLFFSRGRNDPSPEN